MENITRIIRHLSAIKIHEVEGLEGYGDVASMDIFIKTTGWQTLTLSNVRPTDTVVELRGRIHQKQFQLGFAGKQLKEGRLSDYNVGRDATLYETARLEGGGKAGVKDVKGRRRKQRGGQSCLKRLAIGRACI